MAGSWCAACCMLHAQESTTGLMEFDMQQMLHKHTYIYKHATWRSVHTSERRDDVEKKVSIERKRKKIGNTHTQFVFFHLLLT